MHDYRNTALDDDIVVPLDERTPLTLLIEGETPAAQGSAEHELRRRIFDGLLAYFFGDGVDIYRVARRVLAVAWALDFRGLKARMSQSQMAAMFGERRATTSKRVKVMFNDFLSARGSRAARTPGQRGAGAAASAAQQGNRNRTGGVKQTVKITK